MISYNYDKTQINHRTILNNYHRIIKATVGLNEINLIYKIIMYYLKKNKNAS